ncbi:glycosyltransferase [Schinkia azotoformans]|uniref:glycosyltransferase n=1 Tax=Schinkia azotoformans TaxID=1454 RepID=UPI002DBACD7E|nr:glycosyltransferase [Schinkia azotoformans]MEC1760394.1 glycosyltransferase [Schinkia azotoformans]
MSDTKNIVFLGFLPGFGGAEKSMTMIANGLAKLGNKVTIISFKDNNVVYEMDDQVQYKFIEDHEKKKIQVLSNRFNELKKVLTEISPDIVISFWLQPAIYAALISRFQGFKTIYAERADPSGQAYNGLAGFARKIIFPIIDGFVFQTEGAKSFFSRSIQDKGIVINNPVYIKYGDYNAPEKRRKTIINVGRLHRQKNQHLLIDAFAKVNKIYPEYTLEIYGEGELEKELKQKIEDLNLNDRVILKGTTKHLFNEMLNASLFVLSSDYEGMPNALMEAMALGLPCISTDCNPGGARELIKNHDNGLLSERQSRKDLFNCMKYIIEHPEDAEKMGRRAKEICFTHSVEKILNMWENYILKILKGSF